jgi:Mg2+ and Co2+ transporter CorA
MRTLTVVSVIVGAAGCVFGLGGMNNVRNLPSLKFWQVVGGTAVLVALGVGGMFYGARRGWL